MGLMMWVQLMSRDGLSLRQVGRLVGLWKREKEMRLTSGELGFIKLKPKKWNMTCSLYCYFIYLFIVGSAFRFIFSDLSFLSFLKFR